MNQGIYPCMNHSAFYFVAQICALSGCSRIYANKLIERKILPSFRLGPGRTSPHVVPAEHAERWISEFKARKALRAKP